MSQAAAWVHQTVTAVRPRVLAALLRYFRDLDAAEDAVQNACLKALQSWPQQGPPRDPAAWLIFVGRNQGVDELRRRSREIALPDETALPPAPTEDVADRLDESRYRDDILRLLFVCCHPDLPPAQQIPLALRIVCGLSVAQIARAFLAGESAMEQRITRAKRRIAAAQVHFETPSANERAERLAAVAVVIYLIFNQGYSATPYFVDQNGAARGDDDAPRADTQSQLCEEAIRLGRLLLRLFPSEPEIMGLLALMLLQHSRAASRFDDAGNIVLLEDQNRALWHRTFIAEGLALLDKAMRHGQRGAYQVQAAIAALHARAASSAETDWAQIELLYRALEALQPSPVVALNRAAVVARLRGPAAALEMIEPLANQLAGYFYFFGAKGALLQQLGRHAEARVALNQAIALANNPAEALHIRQLLDRLTAASGAANAN